MIASVTLYDNKDLALALTTTLKVIDALNEQTRCIEVAALKKANNAVAKGKSMDLRKHRVFCLWLFCRTDL